MRRILIMEDDIVDRMAIERKLSKQLKVCSIISCTNVVETIKCLEKSTFDWILSDFNLPDGTVQDILKYSGDARVICVSGELESAKIQELKSGGLYKYLVKDHQLNYIDQIIQEIGNSTTPPTKYDSSGANEILNTLKKHFGKDEKYIVDILNILKDKTLGSDIPLLIKSIEFRDLKKTTFLSHKIQSSFRVIKGEDAESILSSIEQESKLQKLDWKKIDEKIEPLNTAASYYLEECNKCLHLLSTEN